MTGLGARGGCSEPRLGAMNYLNLFTGGKMNFKPYHDSGHLYFVTGTIIQWLKLFNEKCYLDIILQSLEWHRNNQKMKVFAFVIMSDHLHWISHPTHPLTVSDNIQSFASYTAHQILRKAKAMGHERFLSVFVENAKPGKSHKIWKNFQAKNIVTEKFLRQKMEYIHNNPVEMGWYSPMDRSEYQYSTACFYDLGKDPVITVDDLYSFLVNHC